LNEIDACFLSIVVAFACMEIFRIESQEGAPLCSRYSGGS
jgi:hypothetical protein